MRRANTRCKKQKKEIGNQMTGKAKPAIEDENKGEKGRSRRNEEITDEGEKRNRREGGGAATGYIRMEEKD